MPSYLPGHVEVDATRCVDVLQYFRAPFILGPGKASDWKLHEQFDNLTDSILKIFTSRGVTVLPTTEWNKVIDRPNDGWHAKQNPRNFVQLTLQLTYAMRLRNMTLLPASMPTAPVPFRQPLTIPVSDKQAHVQAKSILDGYKTVEIHVRTFMRQYAVKHIVQENIEDINTVRWFFCSRSFHRS